jgi:hypothetical protein
MSNVTYLQNKVQAPTLESVTQPNVFFLAKATKNNPLQDFNKLFYSENQGKVTATPLLNSVVASIVNSPDIAKDLSTLSQKGRDTFINIVLHQTYIEATKDNKRTLPEIAARIAPQVYEKIQKGGQKGLDALLNAQRKFFNDPIYPKGIKISISDFRPIKSPAPDPEKPGEKPSSSPKNPSSTPPSQPNMGIGVSAGQVTPMPPQKSASQTPSPNPPAEQINPPEPARPSLGSGKAEDSSPPKTSNSQSPKSRAGIHAKPLIRAMLVDIARNFSNWTAPNPPARNYPPSPNSTLGNQVSRQASKTDNTKMISEDDIRKAYLKIIQSNDPLAFANLQPVLKELLGDDKKANDLLKNNKFKIPTIDKSNATISIEELTAAFLNYYASQAGNK